MTAISKTFEFHAAHRLPNHKGKCARLHGHTYKVEVTAQGNMVDQEGAPDEAMVLDFDVLKDIWRKIEPSFDHSCLLWEKDALAPLLRNVPGVIVVKRPPTAEYFAEILYGEFAGELFLRAPQVALRSVKVWETPTSWAEEDGILYVTSQERTH